MKLKKTASILLACSIAFGAFAGSASANSKLESAVDPLVGIDYKYAGTTTNGFDCSGFTSYVFAKFGIGLPRTSGDQATVGNKISKNELRPGDLVFFNTNGRSISHVGIYMGDGQMAHSSTSRGVIISSIDESYYAKRYVTARRVLSQDQYVALATNAPTVAVAEAPVTAVSSQAVAAEDTEAAPDVILMTEAAELAAEHVGESIVIEEVVQALSEIR